ncbi:MAG: hypothetical protein ACFE7E_02030 [Candidatus Hodarchaeota archaeon]
MGKAQKVLSENINWFMRRLWLREKVVDALDIKPGEMIQDLNELRSQAEGLKIEADQLKEVRKGIRGILGGDKKKRRKLEADLKVLENTLSRGDTLLLDSVLSWAKNLEKGCEELLIAFDSLGAMMKNMDLSWGRTNEAIKAISGINASLGPLKTAVAEGKSNIESVDEKYDLILEIIKDAEKKFSEHKESRSELEKRIRIRSEVLDKLRNLMEGVDEIIENEQRFFKRNLKQFIEKFMIEVQMEEADDDYLQQAIPILEDIKDAEIALVRGVVMLVSAGISPRVILKNQDIDGAVKLMNLLISSFKTDYAEYAEREKDFAEKLEAIAEPISNSIRNIKDLLSNLKNPSPLLLSYFDIILDKWVKGDGDTYNWDELKRRLMLLGTFLIEAYEPLKSCIQMRSSRMNKETIKGISMFVDCIPEKYTDEEFITNGILPITMYEQEIDLVNNAMKSFGERGWIKRGEIKAISDPVLNIYIAYNPSVVVVDAEGLSVVVNLDILKDKLKDNVTYDDIYEYFAKYISEEGSCKTITKELHGIYSKRKK